MVIRLLYLTKETIGKKSMSAENLLRILDEVTKVEHYMSQEFLESVVEISQEMTDNQQPNAVDMLIQGYNQLFDLVSKRFNELNDP